MKQLLNLNATPHIKVTPQLQQAIRLLQLSTLELQNEIQNKIESNPMLEISAEHEQDEPSLKTKPSLPEDCTDVQWSNLYTSQSKKTEFNEDRDHNEHLFQSTINLQDHLRWQLALTPISDIDKVIATTMIDAINEDGMLTCSPSELHDILNSKNHPIDIADIEAVRHRIQQFDPIGCGTCHLSETLLVQLGQLPINTPYLALTKKIVAEQIQLLGKHDYQQLMRRNHIDEGTLDAILHTISHLNPKPGSAIAVNAPEQIRPDLYAKKQNHRWHVELNTHHLPHLSINHYYASLIPTVKNEADHRFLKVHLQEARWFLKSIQSRHETLLKVTDYIVNYQRDFLQYGSLAMKPLTLNDVAKAINRHESTISRVTTQKYVDTPRGLFELKYFFSNHLPTSIGGECSSTAIRAVIKQWIAMEDPHHPFSDRQITERMNAQGISVARRTVTKYRKEMGVMPSSTRKSIDVKH
jgi:RNA polymerase sigma-54 factor